MKKILFLSNTNKLPNRLITLIDYFNKDHKVLLINWQRDPNTNNNFDGIPHINIRAAPNINGLLSLYRQSCDIVSKNKYDFVYCCDYRMLLILYMLNKKIRGKIIYDIMEYNSYYIAIKASDVIKCLPPFYVQPIIEIVEMNLLKLVDGVLVVDSKDDELLEKVRKIQPNSECIKNYPAKNISVDKREVAKYQKKYDGRKLLVYAGNIFEAKGLYRYINLIARLKDDDPSVLLIIAGALSFGEREDSIRRLVKEKGLERHVEFLPWMKYGSLLGLLRNARLGLSLWDPNFFYFQRISTGNSRKTFTYLQAGLPVLVSLKTVGDFVEHHGVGCFVNYNDDEAIYRKAKEILFNDRLFRQMRKRAQQVIQTECNWENELPKVEKVFARALARNRRS